MLKIVENMHDTLIAIETLLFYKLDVFTHFHMMFVQIYQSLMHVSVAMMYLYTFT